MALSMSEESLSEAAAKQVARNFGKVEELEKVDQYRRTIIRRNGGIEAQLKTSVQSQLEDVRTGLVKLAGATQEIQEVRDSMAEIHSHSTVVDDLKNDIAIIQEVSRHHNQLEAACDNLKHIVRVPETVVETDAMIDNGQVLEAHKRLMELETTRDDLLLQLHRTTSERIDSKHPVNHYFINVMEISDKLANHLWFILQRALNVVQSDPTQLVTALRVIEREEKSDKKALDREKQTGFLPPGRPKRWRKKCLDTLEKATVERFESQQPQTDDTIWLAVYLERVKRIIVDDLTTVKRLFIPCFPPSYNIFDLYVDMYHRCLQNLLEDVSSQHREANEIIQLLSWLSTYPDFMAGQGINVDVKADADRFKPLLSSHVIQALEKDYTEMTRKTMADYSERMMDVELQDWQRDFKPDTDVDQHYHTTVAVLLFQMLDQNLSVAESVGAEVKRKIVAVCFEVLESFQTTYREEVLSVKASYLQSERRKPEFYFEYMIAVANNCYSSTRFTEQMKYRVIASDCSGDEEAKLERRFKDISDGFTSIAEFTCSVLLDVVYIDLESHLSELFGKKWLTSSTVLGTVDVTMQDYAQDFKHLKTELYQLMISKAQKRLLVEYIRAMLQRKTRFKSKEERKQAGIKIKKEAQQIASIFHHLDSNSSLSACSVLEILAEVIEIKDTSLLPLELEGLANKHPDMRQEHAFSLLSLRGDVNKSSAKDIIGQTKLASIESDDEKESSASLHLGYFSQVTVPSGSLFG